MIGNLAGLVRVKKELGSDKPWIRVVFVAMRDNVAELPALVRLPSRTGHGGGNCTWPWDAAYVTSAGIVQPCCMVMGDDRVSLGSLAETSFREIWYGPAYRDFRRRLDSAEPPDVCRGCSLYRHTF